MIIDSRVTEVKPRDTAALRRELVAYTEEKGGMYYGIQLSTGGQLLLPPVTTLDQAARRLAADERERLARADLYFWSQDMCDLLAASFPTMPPFMPRPFDLPSERGFCLFAQPIATAEGQVEITRARLGMTGDDLGCEDNSDPDIHAVAWGPVPADINRWDSAAGTIPPFEHGGVWFSFYATPRWDRYAASMDDSQAALLRQVTPPLTQDNELLVSWPGPDAAENDPRFTLGDADQRRSGTAVWGRMVFAAFMLLRQTKLVSVDRVPGDRAERRRAQRAGLPDPEVRVVDLHQRHRPPEESGPTDSGRRYDRWRWSVRQHWRKQWYPRDQVHRPVLIDGFWKGPADAPVKPGTTVHVATPVANPPTRT